MQELIVGIIPTLHVGSEKKKLMFIKFTKTTATFGTYMFFKFYLSVVCESVYAWLRNGRNKWMPWSEI